MQSRSLRGLTGCALLALASCENNAANAPISLDSRLRLAQAASGPGDGRLRLSVLRDAAARSPNDVNILSQLAVAQEQAGSFAEAAEVQRSILALEGPSERRLALIGRLLLRAGDAAGAVGAYEEAVNRAPRSASALGGLGLAEDMAGNRAAAQRAYRRALAVTPTDWAVRSNLGMSLIAGGAAREAIGVLADAEFLPNAPASARHNLALAFAAEGQLDRAVRVLRMDTGQTETQARAMAEELLAFARWLGPTAEASQRPPPPIAAAPQPSRRAARQESNASVAMAPAQGPAAAPTTIAAPLEEPPGQTWLQGLLRRTADALGPPAPSSPVAQAPMVTETAPPAAQMASITAPQAIEPTASRAMPPIAAPAPAPAEAPPVVVAEARLPIIESFTLLTPAAAPAVVAQPSMPIVESFTLVTSPAEATPVATAQPVRSLAERPVLASLPAEPAPARASVAPPVRSTRTAPTVVPVMMTQASPPSVESPLPTAERAAAVAVPVVTAQTSLPIIESFTLVAQTAPPVPVATVQAGRFTAENPARAGMGSDSSPARAGVAPPGRPAPTPERLVPIASAASAARPVTVQASLPVVDSFTLVVPEAQPVRTQLNNALAEAALPVVTSRRPNPPVPEPASVAPRRAVAMTQESAPAPAPIPVALPRPAPTLAMARLPPAEAVTPISLVTPPPARAVPAPQLMLPPVAERAPPARVLASEPAAGRFAERAAPAAIPIALARPVPPAPPPVQIATSPSGRGVAEIGVMGDIGAASAVMWQLSARFPHVFEGLRPVLVRSGPTGWSVRLAGLASLRDAEDLCRQIQSGRQNCVASTG